MRRLQGLAILVPLVALCLSAPRLQAEGPPPCAAGDARPVTVLVRSGAGDRFHQLNEEGDAAPYLDVAAGRTIVPVRAVAELLSPEPGTVTWDGDSRTATFRRGSLNLAITVPPGETQTDTAVANGQPLPTNAFICNDRLFAPASVVASALGAGIRWYQDRTAIIDPAWNVADETPTTRQSALSAEYVRRVAARPESTAASAAQPDASAAQPATSAAQPATSAAQPSVCIGWPESLLDFLRSPTVATRQMALAIACAYAYGQ